MRFRAPTTPKIKWTARRLCHTQSRWEVADSATEIQETGPALGSEGQSSTLLDNDSDGEDFHVLFCLPGGE